jgi:hypothetical protein
MSVGKPLQAPSKMVNGFDPSTMGKLTAPTRNAVNRRNRLLGPAYRLFYQKPLEVDHGQGVHLYDKQGNQYLDAYNNVVSVGHAHPRVVQAVSKQMATLCTHTRYIQEGILNYAEELLPTFGGRVGSTGHAMFTCPGPRQMTSPCASRSLIHVDATSSSSPRPTTVIPISRRGCPLPQANGHPWVPGCGGYRFW